MCLCKSEQVSPWLSFWDEGKSGLWVPAFSTATQSLDQWLVGPPDAKVVLEKIGHLIELNLKSPGREPVLQMIQNMGVPKIICCFIFTHIAVFFRIMRWLLRWQYHVFFHSEHMSVFESEAFCVWHLDDCPLNRGWPLFIALSPVMQTAWASVGP